MSTPILPFAAWQSGTNQNSIPANDNSLRSQVLNGLVIGTANDEAGGDANGDIYIVGSSPSGAFAAFDQFDLAIHMDGNWYAFAPVNGICVNIAGALNQWDGSAYVAVTTGGGGGGAAWGGITGTLSAQTDLAVALAAKAGRGLSIVTEAGTSTMVPATHAGIDIWILAADDVTFDSAEAYTAGQVYVITATAALSLIGSGVSLTSSAGGTLDLDADMTVEVRMTSATAGRVIGQTVPA